MTDRTVPSALNVLNFPLTGSRLIEASAGTGKTLPSPRCTCGWCSATAVITRSVVR